jgi:hypothetical protein
MSVRADVGYEFGPFRVSPINGLLEREWQRILAREARFAEVAMVRAITGEIEFKGKLPITLPELYPIGHGLK